MTTGYKIAGGTDLDALFAPRVSAAAANVNYKSNGGVDLSQRFEPRGATTAIPNTNYKSGATDLAQIFKDIAAAATVTTHSMTAGSIIEGGTGATDSGYAVAGAIAGAAAFGTMSVTAIGSNTLYGIWWNDNNDLTIGLSAGSSPADVDTVWQRVEATGVFQGGGGTQTRTAVRSANTGTSTPTAARRIWTFTPGIMPFAAGNIYALKFYRL